MIYDCEIENCTNKTEDFLCTFHELEAKNENMQIVICGVCNKIVEIKRRTRSEARYIFVTGCMRCDPHQIEPGMFEDDSLLPPLPED